MELREFARGILQAGTLEEKLQRIPVGWTDEQPGQPELWTAPNRAPKLVILPANEVKVPRPPGMGDRSQRRRILHAMANHELQAIELFAWAVLAFPEAPPEFRRGLLGILAEEQQHCAMYVARLRDHEADFGDLGVTGYFWNRAGAIRTPTQFACTMGLTFENANLDFAREYGAAATAAGDDRTAAVIARVHADEIRHVAFGWQWLAKWKAPTQSMWDAYTQELSFPLAPAHARGRSFDPTDRRAAGLDEDFIDRLEQTVPKGPGGSPRGPASSAS